MTESVQSCFELSIHFPVFKRSLSHSPAEGDRLRLLQTFEGLLFAECLFFDQIKVNYLNLHFQKQII